MNYRSKQRGQILADLRKRRGFTQKELGEKMHLTSKAISAWETGRNEPNMGQAYDLAKILQVDVAELMLPPDTSDDDKMLKEEIILLVNAYEKADDTTKEMVKRILKIDNYFNYRVDGYY